MILLALLLTLPPVPADYELQIGDEIAITISGKINFTYTQAVSPEGTIFIQSGGFSLRSPESGEIVPAGGTVLSMVRVLDLTLEEARQLAETEFGRYFKNIGVSFSITKFQDVVYVQGEVRAPGAYPFFPGRAVRDYIGSAGGPTDRALLSKSYVLKKDGSKVPVSEARADRNETIVIERVFLKWWQDYLTIAATLTSVLIAWLTITR